MPITLAAASQVFRRRSHNPGRDNDRGSADQPEAISTDSLHIYATVVAVVNTTLVVKAVADYMTSQSLSWSLLVLAIYLVVLFNWLMARRLPWLVLGTLHLTLMLTTSIAVHSAGGALSASGVPSCTVIQANGLVGQLKRKGET